MEAAGVMQREHRYLALCDLELFLMLVLSSWLSGPAELSQSFSFLQEAAYVG